MIVLAIGVVLFAVLHLVPAVPAAKVAMKARTGERAYGMVYGLASVVAIVLIVIGWRNASFIPVYEPPSWGRHGNFGFTFVAFLFLGIFLFRGKWRQITRFPMGIAVVIWAVGHLLANGDWASIILFGGLMGYGLLHIALGVANGVRPTAEVRAGHDLMAMLVGLALYAAMTQLHPVVTGVPVLTLLK
jgi:uncharacterized membrane protein